MLDICDFDLGELSDVFRERIGLRIESVPKSYKCNFLHLCQVSEFMEFDCKRERCLWKWFPTSGCLGYSLQQCFSAFFLEVKCL